MPDPALPESTLNASADEADGTQVESETEKKEDAFLDLPSGYALDAEETLSITLRHPTQLIVLAGGVASGKTTILGSIYEGFLAGPFADFNFAASRSLVGFEQICHLNRLISGGAVPQTERTVPSVKPTFYHLELADQTMVGPSVAQGCHVLLAAVSGELFRLARDSSEDCASMTFLRRADSVVVLVDGAKLSQMETRANALADASGILDSFLDGGVLAPSARIEFVFSKYDCIHAAGNTALAFIANAENRLRTKFISRVPKLVFRKIAARPEREIPANDHGLTTAFREWVKGSQDHHSRATGERLDRPDTEVLREFARFGVRYNLDSGRTI